MSRALRVLHVGKFYPPHNGGMETHLRTLCGELKHVVDTRVIVANDKRETSVEQIDGVSVTRVGRALQAGASPICPQMSRLIGQSDSDIVHIHLPNPVALIAYWVSGHKGRLVITYHSDILRQKLLSNAFFPVLQQVLHRAAAIISSSPNYVEHSPILNPWRNRCRVIPFGVDPNLFTEESPSEINRIRSLFGPKIVLGVGRLVSYKGFRYLVEAMQSVDANLILIGEGPLKAELEYRARSLGVSHKISILSGIQDIRPYYRAADVFALPSCARTEAFGIVQLEAMASGKPVVNTNLDSGVPFVSPHGITGLTVPPKDPSALANAINTILNDRVLAAIYGSAARKRILAEFTLTSMVQRTLEVYNDVAALSKPADPIDQLVPTYANQTTWAGQERYRTAP
jgi:glycosyltransferase involved in cell wall biosynthesis